MRHNWKSCPRGRRKVRPLKNKIRSAKSRIVCYSNTVATYNVILTRDIETNPGPGLHS